MGRDSNIAPPGGQLREAVRLGAPGVGGCGQELALASSGWVGCDGKERVPREGVRLGALGPREKDASWRVRGLGG
jgi:hypothetical protein